MRTFVRRRGRRPRLHHDHRVRARHTERQHDHHQPRGRAGAGPALPAARPRGTEQPARLRLPPLPASRPALGRGAASGCRRSSTPRSWAPASRSPSPTSRSGAPATSSAASSPATWRASASTSTRACWPRRSRSGRPPRRRAPSARAPGATVDLPVDAHLPDDYVPDEAQKLELYRRLGRVRSAGDLAAFRQEVADRFGPLPPPVVRLLEVAELRLAAEAAGIASIAREEGSAGRPLRQPASRAAEAMRLVAGAPLPGVRPGDVTFAATQVRIRAPRTRAGPGP